MTPFDVIGRSTDGLLALSIALPPVKTGPSETLSGLADVESAHLLPLFRRDGAPCPTVAIRRVKAGDDFRWIVREMVAWFEARDVEHAPEESTIRPKITPIWRELSRL